MTERNRYLNYMYKRSLPPVRNHHIIYVPKMLHPLTVEDLANKRILKREDVEPEFFLRKKGYDPKYGHAFHAS